MEEKVLNWWNNLTPEQRISVKVEYHKYFEFTLIRDLSDSDIRVAYVLTNRGELNYY